MTDVSPNDKTEALSMELTIEVQSRAECERALVAVAEAGIQLLQIRLGGEAVNVEDYPPVLAEPFGSSALEEELPRQKLANQETRDRFDELDDVVRDHVGGEWVPAFDVLPPGYAPLDEEPQL